MAKKWPIKYLRKYLAILFVRIVVEKYLSYVKTNMNVLIIYNIQGFIMTDENVAIDEVLLKKSPKKFAADIEELVWE